MARITLDREGWARQARKLPSPHQDARPQGEEVDLAVIHSISLPRGVYGNGWVEMLFLGHLSPQAIPDLAGARLSAHFFIARTGMLTQFVPTTRRAWHAGKSSWRGREQVNDFSVGIELEGTDDSPFAEAQYRTLTSLFAGLVRRHRIRALTSHAHIAPKRKTDPGPFFEWKRFSSLR